jgi:hypothetical protein
MRTVYTTGRSGASTKSDDFTKFRFEWLGKLARDPAVSPFAFRVGFMLSTYVNRLSRVAWPKFETLAKELSCSRDGVRKVYRQLLRMGYLARDPSRGPGRSICVQLRPPKGDSHHPFQATQRVTTVAKKSDSRPGKQGQRSPQNSLKNPLKNPTDIDREAGSLATALPTGALAHPLGGKHVEAETASRQTADAVRSTPKPLNPHADKQRCLNEIAGVLGWGRVCSLSEPRVDELCGLWSEKKIRAEDLLAEFPNGAPEATVARAAGIGQQANGTELATSARAKRPADCKRIELEAIHSEKRAQKNVAQT